MGIRRDRGNDLAREGGPDPRRLRRLRKKTVIVPAAVPDPVSPPVEGHGGDDHRLDLSRGNGPDEPAFGSRIP